MDLVTSMVLALKVTEVLVLIFFFFSLGMKLIIFLTEKISYFIYDKLLVKLFKGKYIPVYPSTIEMSIFAIIMTFVLFTICFYTGLITKS